jgi:hypothetical protein
MEIIKELLQKLNGRFAGELALERKSGPETRLVLELGQNRKTLGKGAKG